MPNSKVYEKTDASYMTLAEADAYYNSRRSDPMDMIYFTSDPWEYKEAKQSLHEYRATTLGNTYGFVEEIKAIGEVGSLLAWQIRIRPTPPERHHTSASKMIEQLLHDNRAALKEDSMKVYEGIIVKIDDQCQPVEVLKVIAPFVAKDANQAVDEIRVEYARENKLTGKDAAALRVRVREFPVS